METGLLAVDAELAVGVVAHAARLTHADRLADQVGAAYVSVDDGTLGCDGNHRKVWSALSDTTADWCVVLEDDAEPVDNFQAIAAAALAQAPASIVSFYLGTSNPACWQSRIGRATRGADRRGSAWIVSTHLLHAVAVAIRHDLVADWLRYSSSLPIDERISAWAIYRGISVAYTWPSLVNHRDGSTLVAHRDGSNRRAARKAWRCGVRDSWETPTVAMLY